MLAIKCLGARWDSHDKDDVIFLTKLLKISKAEVIFDLIEGYYPKSVIPAKARFFIEEMIETIVP